MNVRGALDATLFRAASDCLCSVGIRHRHGVWLYEDALWRLDRAPVGADLSRKAEAAALLAHARRLMSDPAAQAAERVRWRREGDLMSMCQCARPATICCDAGSESSACQPARQAL